MRVVVDTNVIVYYLLGTEPFVEELKAFWAATREPIAPASWQAEAANALWMAVRAKVLTLPEAVTRLEYATALGIESIPIGALWKGALARAVRATVAVYDTLFIELADREGLSVATFDGPVLKKFPGIARRPQEIVAKIRPK